MHSPLAFLARVALYSHSLLLRRHRLTDTHATGALSDSSPGGFRRRFYIVLSTLLIILSTIVIAYARELASLLCSSSIFGGVGDWDPQRKERERLVAIAAGVLGFYVLDFSLNGLQASLRVRRALSTFQLRLPFARRSLNTF